MLLDTPEDTTLNKGTHTHTQMCMYIYVYIYSICPLKKPSKNAPDEMVEIRFYVPGTRTKEAHGSDAGSQHSDDGGEEISAAQAFHDAVKEKAEIGQVAGDIVLSFEEVNVLTPRGRYDVDMFPDFLRLRGKTYDYKILYASISKLFLLPKDDLHALFIVSGGVQRALSRLR